MDAEVIYLALRHEAEDHGLVSNQADELLGMAAEAMAADERNIQQWAEDNAL